MDLVKVEDSYADRRQLFKDIWDTASNLDDKDADITNKPRVIKTLRLDDEDRSVVGKKNKKLKLKKLRTVCNKLLDFCDKREANETINEQVKTYRVVKKYKIKKKAKKIRIPSSSTANPTSKIETVAISSERREGKTASSEKEANSGDISEPSRDCSPSAQSPVHTISKPARTQKNSSALLKHSAHHKTKRSTKKSKKSLQNLVNSSDSETMRKRNNYSISQLPLEGNYFQRPK